jgi:hypothetical protein
VGKDGVKKPRRFLKFLIGLICVLVLLCGIWLAFSFIGRISPDSVVPNSAFLRVSIAHPLRLLDGILSHEPLQDISAVPELASSLSMLKDLEENPVLQNRLLRFALRGNLELAMLQTGAAQGALAGMTSGSLILAWDLGICSPLLRILPTISGFVNVPNLYYVSAGKNCRFEYRMEGKTFYIGPFRNLLYITDNSTLFESRSDSVQSNKDKTFNVIKP